MLLVEDNPEVASASADLLEQLGYLVRWVPNAEAALEEIERNGIDLVVSDIVMPGRMDGLGLARAIKEKRPELPIHTARHDDVADDEINAIAFNLLERRLSSIRHQAHRIAELFDFSRWRSRHRELSSTSSTVPVSAPAFCSPSLGIGSTTTLARAEGRS